MATDKEFITVVSGLPRSGTSMMMRMLESGGMPLITDGVRGADDDNPRGYYEFEPVKRLDRDASWLPDAYNKAIKIIYIFLYNLPYEHRYKVLFLRRRLEEVVLSQKVMLHRRNEEGRLNDGQLIETFNDQLQRLYKWIEGQKNIEITYLDYQQILIEPEKAVLDIIGFLGLSLDMNAMIQAVEPSLHRHRSSVL